MSKPVLEIHFHLIFISYYKRIIEKCIMDITNFDQNVVFHWPWRLGITVFTEYTIVCKTNTLTILMHQMRISTTQVSSVILRSKKFEIRKKQCKN
jgi:hypothetical protein